MLAPAAEGLQEGTGHHHIVVDGGVVQKGEAIPFDATHLHFGKAQKEATVGGCTGCECRRRIALDRALVSSALWNE